MGRKREIVQPSGWARPKGYSNGVAAAGRWLFVAGQIGWDPRASRPKFPKTFAAQFDQALSNFLDVVRAAGGAAEDVAKLTVYVVDKREYLNARARVGEAWRKHMGRHFPAMALVEVSALLEKDALVEIQAIAAIG